MYKITIGDNTVVGTNEDAWRTASQIWFETGKNGEYGACFTGSRWIGENSYAAQSGMNEHGLVYSRLGSYHPQKSEWEGKQKKKILQPDIFLKQILHKCKNVREVHDLLEEYDHSIYIQDVFIFIDQSGQYLIVEPYSMSLGTEANYVLSNFCPSITLEDQRRELGRYRKGTDVIAMGVDSSLTYCTSLSKAMHVCREKNGDGTLLTGIWNIKNREVNLYFYHDYSQGVSFNIQDELAKGDHAIDILTLFPTNVEFEQLKSYVTPFNSPKLRISIALLGVFFLISSLLFGFSLIRNRSMKHRTFKGLFSLLCLIMFCYMLVLATNIGVYYFEAPYVHFNSNFISISSYIPFIMLLAILPSIRINYKIIKEGSWSLFWKFLLTLNNVFLIILFMAFFYWGLYDVL